MKSCVSIKPGQCQLLCTPGYPEGSLSAEGWWCAQRPGVNSCHASHLHSSTAHLSSSKSESLYNPIGAAFLFLQRRAGCHASCRRNISPEVWGMWGSRRLLGRNAIPVSRAGAIPWEAQPPPSTTACAGLWGSAQQLPPALALCGTKKEHFTLGDSVCSCLPTRDGLSPSIPAH